MTELSPGIYEHVVTNELAELLRPLDPELAQRSTLDSRDAPDVLARHVAALTRRALRAVAGRTDSGGNDGDDGARRALARQVELANRIADTIAAFDPDAASVADQVAGTRDLLTAIADPPAPPATPSFPVRPSTPLATGALLVNGRHQPRIGHEVTHEMASADGVDLLCAFVKWHGLRLVEPAIRELIGRGGRLRVITTTYLGATDLRAIDRLAELGADIRISYETRTTRLHAKAWLFRRGNGTSTAYVGSSNLSRAALVDGVEWNVRVSNLEQPYVIDTFVATFDDYWSDPAFEAYHPERDRDRLRRALDRERIGTAPGRGGTAGTGTNGETDDPAEITGLDVRPYGYQREILAELAAERLVHGRWRNLVVMATGTGKTVVAALDYRDLRDRDRVYQGRVESLLFVAHQEQILRQSRSVFRHVLRDGSFGELLVAGDRPRHWRHVFASIQSLHRLDIAPDRFDMVIVDEFHHAEAPSYAKLLEMLRPQVLLGLTATPDRADGGDVRRWFDGRTAVELHLWEALERQLLAPFHYFGVYDDVDLSALRWRRGQGNGGPGHGGQGYDTAELGRLYTGNDARARLILQAVRDKADPGRMRALGFCVNIAHAEFMAGWFDRCGVPSAAVTSQVPPGDRRRLLDAFHRGELRVLFTVDLFNEGVDLPTVDTILLLRPTESATIFLQQLGRGLRLAEGKPCLTVLDFIGGQHANFRFDLRWRALAGISRRAVRDAVEQDFPTLPSGCHIELDRVAKEAVLANLRRALPTSKTGLVAELRQLGATAPGITLARFLHETGLEVEDVYRRAGLGGWTGLRRLAGLTAPAAGPTAESSAGDRSLGRAIGRMLHIDDPDRIGLLRAVADGAVPPPGRLADMVHVALWNRPAVAVGGAGAGGTGAGGPSWHRLRDHPERRAELGQLAQVLQERIRRVTRPAESPTVPLRVHARYSRDEALAAFGVATTVREGVKWVEAERADLFFVTLVKSERHYSPTTMYADRALAADLFQWESQSTTSAASPTGRRYREHAARGSTVHLFVRETKVGDGDLGAPPYLYAGPMTYVSHTGDRPMRITWRLSQPLPADVYAVARVVAA